MRCTLHDIARCTICNGLYPDERYEAPVRDNERTKLPATAGPLGPPRAAVTHAPRHEYSGSTARLNGAAGALDGPVQRHWSVARRPVRPRLDATTPTPQDLGNHTKDYAALLGIDLDAAGF